MRIRLMFRGSISAKECGHLIGKIEEKGHTLVDQSEGRTANIFITLYSPDEEGRTSLLTQFYNSAFAREEIGGKHISFIYLPYLPILDTYDDAILAFIHLAECPEPIRYHVAGKRPRKKRVRSGKKKSTFSQKSTK